MDPAVVEQMFEQGLMGIEIPEEYGGAGMNFTAAIVAIEELARVDPSVSVMCDVHNTLVNTAILKHGDAQIRKTWLPRLATDTVGSFCLSEPVSGSDAFALQTKAVRTADGYAINGSKMWITNSMEAGLFIVFANLEPSKGYKGITAFIVERNTPGFSIAKKEKKLGIRASSTCVLNFDDVKIPKTNLLGEEGQGYKYAISLLNEGRIGIAAQMTGLALGAWENAARLVPRYIYICYLHVSMCICTNIALQLRLERPQAIRPAHRHIPRNAAPTGSGIHRNQRRTRACVQCGAEEGSRPGLRRRCGHG